MNFFKGLLMLTLLTASVAGQIEHAPTVAQCQADQRVGYQNWSPYLSMGTCPT